MTKLGVFKTYECDRPEQRLLARVVVPHKGYDLEKGREIILGPIASERYAHANNCYGYHLDTGIFKGRYSWTSFEIIGVFDSLEAVQEYMKTRSPEELKEVESFYSNELPASPVVTKKPKEKLSVKPFEDEQLSLF